MCVACAEGDEAEEEHVEEYPAGCEEPSCPICYFQGVDDEAEWDDDLD